jgi:hypothetical protein
LKITLDGEFTTQNEYIKAERASMQWAADIKSNETMRVFYATVNRHQPVAEYPVDFIFIWYRKDRRTDPDNVAFSTKYILDGLQLSHLIENDGWKQVNSITHIFRVDRKSPRVEIFIEKAKKGVA